MALSLPVRLGAKVIDGLNVEAWTYAYALVDPSATATSLLAFLTSWLEAQDACSDGQILEGTMTMIPALPNTLKTGPTDLSRVEQTGVLNFLAAGTNYRWAEIIPALSNGPTVTSGGKIVLTPGNPPANLIGVLLGGSAILEWTNSNQQVLTSFKDSLISFREYNRQVAVATFER